ncbi:MAG: DHH family phosphoesterase, partial [Erysipelotrichaceae bacterium]|nr:DHH family phosphoesterase [Erysipelotrichaceae bacterium]
MNKKVVALLIAILIICVPSAYILGRNSAGGQVTPEKEAEKQTDAGTETGGNTDLEFLYKLNRAELEKLVLIDGPVYVIGHKSPDSDTVCSAIAYAALMNKLGIDAKPVVAGPINNESKYILERAGVEVPEILYDASGTNIIMVDHSEYAQAVDGLADANIVSIIDHHGVGTVNVGHQLLYNAKPIGATATSIWMTYLNYGVEIDQPIAQILLGAILSDTDNLTASTTISADIKAVETLSKTAGIDDLEEYY